MPLRETHHVRRGGRKNVRPVCVSIVTAYHLVLFLSLWAVGCTTEAVSIVRDATPLGPCPDATQSEVNADLADTSAIADGATSSLCREAFQAGGDTGADSVDQVDEVELDIEPDYSARLGQACSLLNACNEFSERVCCDETVKCTLDNQGLGICVAAGDKGPGEHCGEEGFDDCVAGLFCVDPEDDGTEPRCFQFCNPLSPDCPANQDCSRRLPWAREAVGLCGL